MKKILSALVLATVIIILAVTCPDRSMHQEAIRHVATNVVEEKMQKELSGNSFFSGMAFLGSTMAMHLIDNFLNRQFKVTNYVVFSVGEVEYGGETRVVSFGILNRIYAMDEEDLKEAINDK